MPAEAMVFATGSYKSARLPGVLGLSLLADPPWASTLPSGSKTAFIWMRPEDMLGPGVQAGEGAERSMISVVLVAGLSPPK